MGRVAHAKILVGERMNLNLTEIARTMLIDAGMEKYWLGTVWIYSSSLTPNGKSDKPDGTADRRSLVGLNEGDFVLQNI